MAPMLLTAALGLVAFAAPAPAPTPEVGELLLKLHPDRDASMLGAALEELGIESTRAVFRRPPRGWAAPAAAAFLGLDRWVLVRLPAGADLAAASARLASDPAVQHCAPSGRWRAADTVPDDPLFAQQYPLQNDKLAAPRAWDLRTSSEQVVAILDTGMDLRHVDLVDNVWRNEDEIRGNGIDDDGNGFVDDWRGWDFRNGDNRPMDENGHGTHCAGIAGARGNNATLVSGVCWEVPLMVVQVLGKGASGDWPDIAAGIVYAADNGASVISLSLGGTQTDQVLEDAVVYAASLDALVVAAAGNLGLDIPFFPAYYADAMAVISTDQGDQKAISSNFGDWCDLAAPGVDVLSTWLGDSTALQSGTSMACPHVAGAAALVRELNPTLDAVDTRLVLNHSAADLGAPGKDPRTGWGRLQLDAALERAQSLMPSQSVARGGDTVVLELQMAAAEAGHLYLLLAGTQGRVPGLPAARLDSGDLRVLPLNDDPFLFPVILAGGAGVFQGFLGALDAAGHATAAFAVPPGRGLGGADISFAYATFDPALPTTVQSLSASVQVQVE